MAYPPFEVWRPVEDPWQYRVLDALPSGVDRAQLERARKWTFDERLDALTELMELAEALKSGVTRAKFGPKR